jgi:hypothetical protein
MRKRTNTSSGRFRQASLLDTLGATHRLAVTEAVSEETTTTTVTLTAEQVRRVSFGFTQLLDNAARWLDLPCRLEAEVGSVRYYGDEHKAAKALEQRTEYAARPEYACVWAWQVNHPHPDGVEAAFAQLDVLYRLQEILAAMEDALEADDAENEKEAKSV